MKYIHERRRSSESTQSQTKDMFPNLVNSTLDKDPFSYTNHNLGTNEPNPKSTQEDPPSSLLFLHFPSPFLDTGLDPLVPQQVEINHEQTPSKLHGNKRSNVGAQNPNPRKIKTSKRDRHSKIRTAQGFRDRRMRLSVPIARKFFDLQDMLGFAKASNTIAWLFSESKAAINELKRNLPQMDGCGRGVLDEFVIEERVEKGETLMGIANEKNKRKSRKAACNPHAKESRDKARAKARERTRERMIIRSLRNPNQCLEANHVPEDNLEELGSSRSLFETPNESSSMFRFQNNPAVSNGEEMYYSNNTSLLGILGNWELDTERISSNYCAMMTNMVPHSGNVQEQNTLSSSNIQFLENNFSCRTLDG